MASTSMSSPTPPLLLVSPVRALVDEIFSVQVENLPPGFPVTLRALHHSEDKDDWEAYAHYISDHRGALSVSHDASFGGTFTGKEPMGLMWSMRPVPGSRTGLRLRKMDVTSPLLIHISLHAGHQDFREQTPLASVLMERWYMAPGVQRVGINHDGVRGTLFIPPGPGPFPGLMDMWGGGGGLVEYRSALLASHGFVSLALEYFKPGELGSAELEYRYFEKAVDILKTHPQVMSDRVGLFGLSLGATLTMYLAANSKTVNPRCCVCVGGNHCFTKSSEESPIRFSTNVNIARRDENNHYILRDFGLKALRDGTNKIRMGRVRCPIMVVTGTDDQNVPASESAEDIAAMMREAGNEHLLTRLDYPGAGHLIEPPFSPHFRGSNFFVHGQKVIMSWGGQPKPHSDAQEDSWRKMLVFLRLHLYGNDSPRAKL